MKFHVPKSLTRLLPAMLLAALLPNAAQAAPFTPGNLVVLRIGDGVTVPSAAASAVFLDEYTTAGALVQSIPMPTAAGGGNYPLTTTNNSLEGELHLSADGQYLTCAGYGAVPGTAALAISTNNGGASDVPRVLGRIDPSGTVNTTTALIGTVAAPLYTGTTIRDALFAGNHMYSCGGTTPSVGCSTLGANTAAALLASGSIRALGTFGGDLYYMGSGAIYKFTGLPTTSSTGTTIIGSLSGASGFAVTDTTGGNSVNVCYIQDNSNLKKYALISGVWTAKGTLATAQNGMVTAKVAGGSVHVYISSGVKIQSVLDTTGTNDFSSMFVNTVVAAAPANVSFHGIAMAPAAYTLTYDANNATTGTAPVDSTIYGQFTSATVSTNSGNLARTAYTFNGWNTAADGTGTNYATGATLPMSSGNVTLYAKWVPDSLPTYTITASGGTGGTIAPTGIATLSQGDHQSYTIAPSNGFVIDKVLVDGVNNTDAVTSGSYTFSNVTANHTIEASFLATYTITASAGANGTISPVGATTLNSGSTQAYSITANSGYSVYALLVDGVAQAPSTSYSFTNVTANHTIQALFVAPATSTTTGIISVNYKTGTTSQGMAATDSVGALPATHWNNIDSAGVGGFATPAEVFNDNNGQPVGPFSVQLSSGFSNTWNAYNASNRNVDMLSSWGLNSGGTATFSNIPYVKYNLYVYFAGFASNVVSYAIGSDVQTLNQTLHPGDVPTSGFVQNNNYVKFTNLTGTSQSMLVTYISGNGNSGIAGFQIEAVPSTGDTFADWIGQHGPATGFSTDSDHDGIPNGVECILGTDPNTSSKGMTQIASTANSITCQHTLNASLPSDITRSYQWSTDLSEWKASGESNTGGVTATIASSTASGVVTVTTTITGGISGKLFCRLVATQP